MAEYNLKPIDYDPFAEKGNDSSLPYTLKPVDYDPFAEKKGDHKNILTDSVNDIGIGTLRLPGAVTGLLDIAPGLVGIDRPFDKLATKAGEVTGFQPKKWADESAKKVYSDERNAANSEIDNAWSDPNTDAMDVAKAYAENPRATLGNVVESLPSMVAGGIIGRASTGLKSAIAAKEAGTITAEQLAKKAAFAAGVGEGTIMAGQQMDNIDHSADPQTAAEASLLTGAAGGAIGVGAGRLANRMGIADAHQMIASGGAAGKGTSALSYPARIVGGALQEGPIEEGTQSVVETGAQNYAEGNPLSEGMARNVVEGSLAGSAMGVGANLSPRGDGNSAKTAPATDNAASDQRQEQSEPGTATPEQIRGYAEERIQYLEAKDFINKDEHNELESLKNNLDKPEVLANQYGLKLVGDNSTQVDLGNDNPANPYGSNNQGAPEPVQVGPRFRAPVSKSHEQSAAETIKSIAGATTVDEAINAAASAIGDTQSRMPDVRADGLQPWKAQDLDKLQGQADKNRAFYEQEQADIQRKQDEIAQMELHPDATPKMLKEYRNKRIELENQKRQRADDFRNGLGFNVVPYRSGEVKNTQLRDQLLSLQNDMNAAEERKAIQSEGNLPAEQHDDSIPLDSPGMHTNPFEEQGPSTWEEYDLANQPPKQKQPTKRDIEARKRLINARQDAGPATPIQETNPGSAGKLTDASTVATGSGVEQNTGAGVDHKIPDTVTVFNPTHVTSDGVPVEATDKPNIWIDSNKDEIRDDYATKLESSDAPREVSGTNKPSSNVAAELPAGKLSDNNVDKPALAQKEFRLKMAVTRAKNKLKKFDGNLEDKLKLKDAVKQSEQDLHNFRLNYFDHQDNANDQTKTAETKVSGEKSADQSSNGQAKKQGEIGQKLSEGESVLTSSGRETTPFPKFSTRNGKTTPRHLKSVDSWLMDNAIAEAESRSDDFNSRQFKANRDNPSQSDKDSAEEYLFVHQPEVHKSILKPLSNNVQENESTKDIESVRVEETVAQKQESDEIKKAKADLDAALGDLGYFFMDNNLFSQKVVPGEFDDAKLMPIMARVIDAAIRLGYVKFKDAAKFTLDTVRDKFGDKAADSLTIDHLQGGYIAVAAKHKELGTDSKRDVVDIESLDEIHNYVKTDQTITNQESDHEASRTGQNSGIAGAEIDKSGIPDKQQRPSKQEGTESGGGKLPSGQAGSVEADSGKGRGNGLSEGTGLARHQTNASDQSNVGREDSGDSGVSGTVGADNYDLRDKPNVALTPAKRRDINNLSEEILKKPIEDITDADKNILRQYTGNGGLSAEDSVDKGDSIFNQHYTNYPTIKAMYSALLDAGIKIKKALEPSVGSGNFVGMYPHAEWSAVDVDKINTEIVKRLYPDSQVFHESYETFRGKNFDLIIGNVPFASVSALPRQHMLTVKPAFKAIHNFFFAQSVDKLKTGGIMAFMTSTGTMDGIGEAKNLRVHLVKQMDVIGAFRLPMGSQKANASTDVMIDVIFLQKRPEGVESKQPDKNQSFVDVASKDGHKINQYFVDYPDSVLGELSVGKNKTSMGKVGWIVTGEPDYSKMSIEPQDYTATKKAAQDTFKDQSDAKAYAEKNGLKFVDNVDKPYFKDGIVYDQPVHYSDVSGSGMLGRKAVGVNANKLAALQEIENTLNPDLVVKYENTYGKPPHTDKMLQLWAKVNHAEGLLKSYEALFDKHFALSEIFTKQVRFTDSGKIEITKDSPLHDRAESLENTDGILSTNTDLVSAEEVQNLLDSGDYARVSDTKLQNSWMYYAGNIYKKIDALSSVKPAVQHEKQHEKLNNILPPLIPINEISVTGNESWLPPAAITAIGRQEYKDGTVIIGANAIDDNHYLHLFNAYLNNDALVKKGKNETTEEHIERVKAAWNALTHEVFPLIKQKLMDDGLADEVVDAYNRSMNFFTSPVFNGSSLKNLPTTFRGKPFKMMVHQQEGAERAIYNKKGVLAFSPGLGKTPTAIIVADQLLQKGVMKKPLFIVPANTIPQWEETTRQLYPDAKVFEFPKYKTGINKGKVKDWPSMTPDDKERMVHDLANNRYDYTFISTNLAQKFTIPEKKLAEYIDDLTKSMISMEGPEEGEDSGKKPSKSELKAKEKRLAKIRMLKTNMLEANKQDASAGFDMGKLGFDAIFADEVQYYKNIGMQSEESKGGIGASVSINAKYPLGTDGNPNKEADPISVTLSSARSYDFRFKTRYISENNNGNNVFLLTGTPTPNKPLELMTLLYHLDTHILEEYGIKDVGDFVNEFLEVSDVEEQSLDGSVKLRPQLTGIKNIPALKKIITRYVDYRSPESAKDLTRPKQIDITHPILRSETAESVFADIQSRLLQAIEDGKKKMSGEYVSDAEAMIQMYTAGRDASIDLRLYTPTIKGDIPLGTIFEEENRADYSKIAKTVQLVAKQYAKDPESGQLIFLDRLKFSGDKGSTHEEIRKKIIEATGLSPNEVVFVNGGEYVTPKTGEIRKGGPKPEMLQTIMDDYNAGKIKVLIGNTSKLGVGVDLQVTTTDIYQIDKLYRPDEIEQRNNRGVRQGNRNTEVRVHSFNQPGTFDEMSDRIIANKQGFNDVFWKDQDSHTADIKAEEMPTAYDAAIELEQDPYKKRKLQIERDLSQAAAKTSQIEKQISNIAKRIRSAKENKHNYELSNKGIDSRAEPKYEDQSPAERKKSLSEFHKRMADQKAKNLQRIGDIDADLVQLEADKEARQQELNDHKGSIADLRSKYVVNGLVSLDAIKANNDIKLSRKSKLDYAAKAITALAQEDPGMAQSPIVPENIKSLSEIAKKFDPDYEIGKESILPEGRKDNAVRSWIIKLPPKPGHSLSMSYAKMYQQKYGNVFVDVSTLSPGDSGNKIYALVGNFARNNGVQFIGDPNGLSKMAMIRRTENMLSLAAKFGTTSFMRPHGLQGIDWNEGDDAGNFQNLLEKSQENIMLGHREAGTGGVPELNYIEYNFDAHRFEVITSGREFTNDDFNDLARKVNERDHDRRVVRQHDGSYTGRERTPKTGRETLKRAALIGTLVRSASGGGWGQLLDQFARQSDKHLALKKILYSKSSGESYTEISQQALSDTVNRIADKWAGGPEIVQVETFSDLPESVQKDAEEQGAGPGDVKGVSYQGKIYLVRDALESAEDAEATLFHEATHNGLQKLIGNQLDSALDRLYMAIGGKQGIARLEEKHGIDLSDYREGLKGLSPKKQRATLMEEMLAHMGGKNDSGFWQKAKEVLGAIRHWLRDNGFAKLSAYNDADLAHLIAEAKRSVTESIDESIESNDSAKFSRIPKMQIHAAQQILESFTSAKTFNWVQRNFGTGFGKAIKDKDYRRVFQSAMNFENDTARIANETADEAPDILPKTETIGDTWRELKTGWKRTKDSDKVGEAIFETTMRDSLMSNSELQRDGYTDVQIKMYRQFFASVNKSLDELAKSEMYRMARSLNLPIAPNNLGMDETALFYEEHAKNPNDAIEFRNKAKKIKELKSEGYAPLMRFGIYTVDVNSAENVFGKDRQKREFFGMFETELEAKQMAKLMQDQYPDATVKTGIMSQKSWELFKGITPETMEIYAKALGVDEDTAFQEYLKTSITNRSALKRLIHRKKMPGFSKDVQRILATFLTSNARAASKNYHMGEMLNAISQIDKNKGDVIDEAVDLYNHIQNPSAGSSKLRTLLFAWYLGGTAAAAMVNLSQTFTTTLPYLHQFGGSKKSALHLSNAMYLANFPSKMPDDIAKALKRADEQGITAPHELHMLYGESSGRTSIPYLAHFATASKAMRPIMKAWGAMFQAAEAYNRRVAFIAAYSLAKENGGSDPFKAGEDSVKVTQFIYSKANQPALARSYVGSLVFTFKMFTINYLEFLGRLPPKERMIALGVLVLFAGMSGLPGTDDLDDMIDTLGQNMGYNTNSKEWKQKVLTDIFGKELAMFALHGMSSFLPVDISQRLSAGNIIPGSSIFKKSETDKTRDALEFAGPAGSLIQKGIQGFEAANSRDSLAGGIQAFGKAMLPKAFTDAWQAMDMLQTGHYRDYKGRNIVETDRMDAAAKFLGLQPANVAEPRRQERYLNQDVTMTKEVKSDINELWAEGIAEKDAAKVNEARDMMKKWNSRNPETPIRVKMSYINKRVKDMRRTSGERLLKATPKELRHFVGERLSEE